jgi:hypothetical protein
LSTVLDLYERKARLAPALLASLPLALLFVSFGAKQWQWAAVGVAAEAAAVIPLAELARDRGKSLQRTLWAEWGSSPLARLLADEASTTARMARDYIHRHFPGLAMTTGAQAAESSNPELYEAVGEILRHHVRGVPGREVVAAENRSYGFQRNLLGMQSIGIGVSLVSAAAALALLIGLGNAGSGWSGVCTSLGLLTFWLVYPSELRVQQSGERYAEAVIGMIASHAVGTNRETPR